jgi:hypothetical protein
LCKTNYIAQQKEKIMAKHHFIVKRKSQNYDCFLDEQLCLSVLNERSKVIVETKLKEVIALEDVKGVASALIKCHLKTINKDSDSSGKGWSRLTALRYYFFD